MRSSLSATQQKYLIWGVLVALAVYLLFPALTPVHIEGFTASIVSIALHLRDGNIGAYDRLHGANLEFFALSRLGVNLFVEFFSRTFHVSAEQALHLMMWIGGVILAIASFPLIRKWADCGTGAALIFFSLLLLPGISESTFFYNDNVISAGLTVAALAVAAASPRLLRWGIAGALFGLGVVARFDAVLLAVAFPLIAFEQNRSVPALVRRGLVFGVIAAIVILGIDAAYGTNPLAVLSASRYAVFLWHRDLAPYLHLKQVLYFVGLPGAMLIVLGAWQLLSRREYLRLALLAGVPLFYNVVLLGKVWEGRQLLALTPFFAALAVRGIQFVFRDLKGTAATFARTSVVAFTLLVVLFPHTPDHLDDGPRSFIGRAWRPPVWLRWQRAVSGNLAELRSFMASVGAPGPGPVAVMTDEWNADRYTHMVLQEDGYKVVPIASVYPACASTAELFQRGDKRILHVRMHEPFLEYPELFLAERLNSYAMPCLAAAQPSEMYLTALLSRLQWYHVNQLPSQPWLTRERVNKAKPGALYDPLVVVRYSPAVLPFLERYYARDSVTHLRMARENHAPALNVTQAERMLAPRLNFAQPQL
ncbi:MAG: hypothetical protein ACR2GG_01965 [Gemmatimonadaceae bacterium]